MDLPLCGFDEDKKKLVKEEESARGVLGCSRLPGFGWGWCASTPLAFIKLAFESFHFGSVLIPSLVAIYHILTSFDVIVLNESI